MVLQNLRYTARAHSSLHLKYLVQVNNTQWVLDKCLLTK